MIPINIIINSESVLNDVSSCDISASQDSFCHTVNLTFGSQRYWEICDPNVSVGLLKIQVLIGETTYSFLCEERNSSVTDKQVGFTVWGRSKQALLGAPYSVIINDTEKTNHPWQSGLGTNSQNVISYLLAKYSSYEVIVNYNILQFGILKNTLSIDNKTILEVISFIAGVVGGVLQPEADGSLSINNYSVQEDAAVASYNALNDIITLNETTEFSAKFNAVTVNGKADDLSSEDGGQYISVERLGEETTTLPGGKQRVRVYYYHSEGLRPVTYGEYKSYSCVNRGSETKTEMITFIWGKGNTSLPHREVQTFVIGDVDKPYEVVEKTYTVYFIEYEIVSPNTEGEFTTLFTFEDASVSSTLVTTVEERTDEETSDPLCSSVVLEKGLSIGNKISILIYGYPTVRRVKNSAGSCVSYSGENTETKKEAVIFRDGHASTSYPIFWLTKTDPVIGVSYRKGSNKLIKPSWINNLDKYSVPITVTYQTSYVKYTTNIPSSWGQPTFDVWVELADCGTKLLSWGSEEIPFLSDEDETEVDITITVKDYVSDIPVEEASIYIDGSYVGKTDSSGVLNVMAVTVGNHTIKMTADGYVDSIVDDLDNDNFTVSAG